MDKKTINIEDIFIKPIRLAKIALANRFVAYKAIGLLAAVAVFVGVGVWGWTYFSGGEAQAGWYQDDWKRRVKITIDSSKIDDDLVDFPLLVATTTTAFAEHAQPDGDDFVFVDMGGDKLMHEIESYNSSTGALVAWVKVPEVSASADTSLYIYFGNEAASNQQTASHYIWNDGYAGVWHLPNDANASTTDSTANANNGSSQGTMSGTDSGYVNGAQYFDGNTSYIAVPNDDTLNVSSITLEAWFKSATSTTNLYLMSKDP